eukprot:TRINITY_DN12600_c1_g1_i3.p1 TRINITY_DN12600_c1_g1~~TRINITY_DN12600_c1_g1_i3.p1  ORF type:complete len:207 (+),score=23.63 TRINITY_DN12600_c1_g1_i3:406-1026(+)
MSLSHSHSSMIPLRIALVRLIRQAASLQVLLANGSPLSLEGARVLFRRVARGLNVMHQDGRIHRDLKLENVLLEHQDDLRSAVLADFGLARCITGNNADDSLTKDIGTQAFRAPELWTGRDYDTKVDVWQFGCFVYACVTRRNPFGDDKTPYETLVNRIMAADYNLKQHYEVTYPRVSGLIQGCLQVEPQDRLSMEQVLNHPFFSE